MTLSTDVLAQHMGIRARFSETLPTSFVDTGSRFEQPTNWTTAALTATINAWGDLLVNVSGLISTNSEGLSYRFTPAVGIDYVVARC